MHVECKYSTLIQNCLNTDRQIIAFINNFKAAVLQILKKQNEKNNGKYWSGYKCMFSEKIFYYWQLNSNEKVDKIVVKTSFFFA